MDLGPWVQMVLTTGNVPLGGAFLIGLLASLGPCPLSTNIAALGYITRELASPRRLLLTCGLYTLGRACAYGLLGIGLLAAGLQISRVSNSLQTFAEIALGPVLILVGLVLLDVLHPTLNVGGVWMERWSKRAADWNNVGAFLLGGLFALAFCPYSAALYFGVLIPLAFKSEGGIAFPFIFGLGTSMLVLIVGAPLALGVKRLANALNALARVERGMRKLAALVFIGAGIGMCVGCAISPTPTPSPVPSPVPSPTVMVPSPTGVLSSTGLDRFAPADVPACPGAQELDKPIEFIWTGIEDVRQSAPESNWTFYRCNEPQAAVAAFYRRWMAEVPYGWAQYPWEERASATLGVYYYTTITPGVPNRWLYLWILPDSSTTQSSYLVAAWWQVPKSC